MKDLPELTEAERAAMESIDIHAILRQATGETVEDQMKRASETSIKFFRESCALKRQLTALTAERDRLQSKLEAGCAGLRRYVEANGFEWQDGMSAVDHATTAIGMMGGTIDILKQQLADVTAERDRLREVRDETIELSKRAVARVTTENETLEQQLAARDEQIKTLREALEMARQYLPTTDERKEQSSIKRWITPHAEATAGAIDAALAATKPIEQEKLA